MKRLSRMVLTPLFAVSMLTACCVPSNYGRGGDVHVDDGGVHVNIDGVNVNVDRVNVLPPPLPSIVELGPDRHYQQGGYNYYYLGDRWQYSRDRSDSWSDLPKSHWPNEIRRRGDWR